MDEIRDDGKVEYMYMDILLKSGAIGMVLFLATFFYPVVLLLLGLWKRRSETATDDMLKMQIAVIVAAYISVAVTSWFNPYLSNPMGITLLMITSSAVVLIRKTDNKEKGETL